jgi:hypothetical protein
MSNYKFNPKHLYENTNAGLDIVFKYCPQAIGCERTNKQFKLREDEDTASASLLQKDDCWIVKDFGDKGYNPIELCRYFTGFSFIEALKHLYSEFNLSDQGTVFVSDTTFKTNPEQELGYFEVIEAEKFNHIDLVGRFVDEKTALEYDFISVAQYSFVFTNKKTNEKTLCTTKATENYPIFAYKFCDDWAKIYQPLDKKYKHSFVGKKPERHVYGLTRLRTIFNETIDNFNLDIAKAKQDKDLGRLEKIIEARDNFKIDNVIICSGGSDGLGVASLGYNAIWFNSESEQLNYAEYKELKTLCWEIYNLPDIDGPGTKYGYQVAEMFWNLKSIWLPETIKINHGKDFRDWLKKYSKSNLQEIKFQFANLLTGALKMKFFDRNPKTKALKINTAFLHYFLKVKGFYIYYPKKLYLDKTSEQEFIFIKVENNIVNQEFANTIKKYCERYLIDKGQPIEVINLIKNTTQFTDKNLLGLDPIVLDFKNFTSETQKFYFKNQFATISADGIEFKAYNKLDSHVWSDKIINHNITSEKQFFTHTKGENGENIVSILRNDCEYMNFLINTSRISWRKEIEEQFANDPIAKEAYHNENKFRLTSEYLTPEENAIQEQHFLSKCFGIGYMLHKYKRKSFARLLYIMDDMEKDSEDDRNGGSGKTMILDGIDCLLTNRFKIDGSIQNLFQNPFMLGGLTKENDYILIDDLAAHYSIDPLYVWITGSLTVRPIYKSTHEISFFDVGKIAITRNFGLKNQNGSSLRRIFFISTSDYYHMKSDSYNEERRVSHDFGHDLFLWDKDSKQPTLHFNFLMQCLQYYLQNRETEILAPQKNIDLNNVKAGMGDNFIEWCESYFANSVTEAVEGGLFEETKGTLNEYIPRAEMQDNYKVAAGKFAKTSSNFKKSIQQYCKMKGWIFNPKELQGSDGLIKKPFVDSKGKRQIVEHFYIKTLIDISANEPANELINETDTQNKPDVTKPSDDLPF